MSCNCNEDKVIKEYIQGDTFKRQVSIVDNNGDDIDVSLISKLEFLLLDMDADIEQTEEIDYDSEFEKWIVEIDTSEWGIGTHLVRYRITYVDGTIQTPYEITIQIKK